MLKIISTTRPNGRGSAVVLITIMLIYVTVTWRYRTLQITVSNTVYVVPRRELSGRRRVWHLPYALIIIQYVYLSFSYCAAALPKSTHHHDIFGVKVPPRRWEHCGRMPWHARVCWGRWTHRVGSSLHNKWGIILVAGWDSTVTLREGKVGYTYCILNSSGKLEHFVPPFQSKSPTVWLYDVGKRLSWAIILWLVGKGLARWPSKKISDLQFLIRI